MDNNNTNTQTVSESEAVIKQMSVRNVPSDLWREVRITSIRRGLTLAEGVVEALRAWVDGQAA